MDYSLLTHGIDWEIPPFFFYYQFVFLLGMLCVINRDLFLKVMHHQLAFVISELSPLYGYQ